jgi:hypothetical protein
VLERVLAVGIISVVATVGVAIAAYVAYVIWADRYGWRW